MDGATWLLGTPGDVLRACDRAALDAGVVGSDRLLEGRLGVADLLDLRRCRDELVLAVAPAAERRTGACASPRVTPSPPRRHFAATGAQPEIIVVDEPVLAPALGLADGVVDSRRACAPAAPVGRPLETREVVAACSAHLVASRAARVLLRAELAALVDRLRAALEVT